MSNLAALIVDLEILGVESGGGGAPIANTDALPEGTTNLYHTDNRAVAAVVAGVEPADIGAIPSGGLKTVNGNSLEGSGNLSISASPGGATTQVQFNDAGAFAGDSTFTFNTTSKNVGIGNALVIPQAGNSVSALAGIYFDSHATNKPSYLAHNGSHFWRANGSVIGTHFFSFNLGYATSGWVIRGTDGVYGWTSGGTPDPAGQDAGLARNAEGTVEVNNGGKVSLGGSYGDLRLRGITMAGLLNFGHYTNATEPSFVNGAAFFNDDLDKLRIGGASGWETVTST
jgi:hypothetical protein